MSLLAVPFFAFMSFIRGFGRDELPWYNPWNLFTSKHVVPVYITIALIAATGTFIWPIFTGVIFALSTYWYDKGELLAFLDGLYPKLIRGEATSTHKPQTRKLAYRLASGPLDRLPVRWEYKYGAAAALPYCLALAPWGMPLLPLLYGVIYTHVKTDEIGRILFGITWGLALVLGAGIV